MSPENLLLERSKVCNLGKKPSSGGILPEMLLFCNDLQKKKKIGIEGRETNKKRQTLYYRKQEGGGRSEDVVILHLSEICEISD